MPQGIGMQKRKKDEPPEIFREKILYREWARRFTTMQKNLLAVIYYEKAMKSDEDDVRTLLGLCKAKFHFTKYVAAARLAEKCLQLDPNNYHVKEMRVDTLYRMGEFCYSLLHAYNGFRYRRMPFELGIYRANETIETCVGQNTVPDALERILPWILKLQEYRKVLIEKLKLEPDEFEGIDEDQSKFKVNDPVAQEEAHKAKLQKTIARIYLGIIAAEKEFREQLIQDKQYFESANKESTKLLQFHAKRSLEKTKFRQSIIRSSWPIYLMLFAKDARTIGHKVMIENEKNLKKYNLVVLADFLLRCLHAARMNRDYPTFFRLAMASEPLELAWLFHDFSKFFIQSGRYDLARYYAKKSRDSAIQAKNEQWVLNATHMAMIVEFSQNNRNDAKEAAVAAIAIAKKLGIDYLVDFYSRALNVIDELDLERLTATTDSIAARQKLILELMPEELKSSVDFLFRSMEVVPAKRRLSVMPGCKPVDRKFKFSCKRNTILPSPPKNPEKEARQALLAHYAPSKERPGFLDFQDYE
ncbi:uncharacterized protein LOC122525000 [Polistes fuscatus]|uniref:uncharacterized protein LOC122525000 n=1 Tax=Polistes fuscatus TaxID=30207 RepID=UPI001CA8E61D|nr:uncharacterized protein LOC122525000 [Polistes fuscatus]